MSERMPVRSKSGLDSVRWFVFQHFERVLVVVLVASLLLIHWFVDYKVAFLSFYYLPIIAAGFFLGRNPAVLASVLIVGLVLFFQAVEGLRGSEGFGGDILFTLVPWGGFLILTGYVVGLLAEQREGRLRELKDAYLAVLELLTFHIEASDRSQQGHSHRVAKTADALAEELGLSASQRENLLVAALLHEVGPRDQRLLRLLSRFPGDVKGLPIAATMHGATEILREYERYYELVGDDWPVDRLDLAPETNILAVADAFETLQMPTPLRPAFGRWSAIEEIERGSGRIFASDVARGLKRVRGAPERTERESGKITLLKIEGE